MRSLISGSVVLLMAITPTRGAEPSQVMVEITIPAPAMGLPIPYKKAIFSPQTPDDVAYVRYLQTTSMFPDQNVCDQYLNQKLQSLRPSDVLSRVWYAKRDDLGNNAPDHFELVSEKWVTIPFLAWGGNASGGAVIGPLNRLFTLVESHLVIKDSKGVSKDLTFTCFAKYAEKSEREVWLKAALKYGAYLSEGHRQYLSGPDRIFGYAPPGLAREWDAEIHYYQAD